MEWLQAAVLGFLQGVTEFLPISSSAHLRIVPELFGWEDPGTSFTAVMHLGSVVALLLYFAGDIARITTAWIRSLGNREALRSDAPVPVDGIAGRPRRREWEPADARLGWYIIIGTIPIVIAGVLLNDLVETEFRSLWIVGTTFIVLGIVLWLADRLGRRDRGLPDLTIRDALIIGIAQVGALVPGVSRAGISISMALILGINREAAARFALLLSIPAVIGAGSYELSGALGEDAVFGVGPTILGTVVSFVSAYASIAWLLRWLQSRTYTPFVLYRVIGGLVILGLLAGGVLTP